MSRETFDRLRLPLGLGLALMLLAGYMFIRRAEADSQGSDPGASVVVGRARWRRAYIIAVVAADAEPDGDSGRNADRLAVADSHPPAHSPARRGIHRRGHGLPR